MILYRVDESGVRPVAVECDKPMFPFSDADGKTIYDNTHFASEDDAWEAQRRDVLAEVELAGRAVQHARAALSAAEAEAGRAAGRLYAFDAAHREHHASPAPSASEEP